MFMLVVSFGNTKMNSWSLTYCHLRQVAQKHGGWPSVINMRLERYVRINYKIDYQQETHNQ